MSNLNVGDEILLKWPLEGDERSWRKMKVVKIKECKEESHGSKFKYTLEFVQPLNTDETLIKTRLMHLEWKRSKNEKRKANEIEVVPSIPRVMKKGKMNSIGRIPLQSLQRILAPMVGASELPFRLLCRKYGATLAYTPMMLSSKFATEESYRQEEFQTCPEDRPLVAHFAANDPEIFRQAALLVQDQCDAIDLNLGCPQRVAHSGHFGSFLLDEIDRPLVLSMVHTIATSCKVPIFVKIRLLSTVEETILFCRQLIEAGAAVIAIHARHRVNLVNRSGPTARDGPALLDQVKVIVEAFADSHVPIIANGNVRTYDDVTQNLVLTKAAGIMSAEGILDNPALFYPAISSTASAANSSSSSSSSAVAGKGTSTVTSASGRGGGGRNTIDTLELANEYLQLVRQYPTKLKSIIFHIRRMCRNQLETYQLLQSCIDSTTIDAIQQMIDLMQQYQYAPETFQFNQQKAEQEQKAEERRKYEESRRKEFEARMIRKAKREQKPLDYYLNQGAMTPTIQQIEEMKELIQQNQRDKVFQRWKDQHGQHCWNYHFEEKGCHRDRKCAFLHCEAILPATSTTTSNNKVTFSEETMRALSIALAKSDREEVYG
jgi:tRNA-dihydrouridine synthase 1